MALAVGKTQAAVVAIAGGLLAMVALGAYGEAGPRQTEPEHFVVTSKFFENFLKLI